VALDAKQRDRGSDLIQRRLAELIPRVATNPFNEPAVRIALRFAPLQRKTLCVEIFSERVSLISLSF
jgi:hypothetical protein